MLVMLCCLWLQAQSQYGSSSMFQTHRFPKVKTTVVDVNSSVTAFSGHAMPGLGFGLYGDLIKDMHLGFSMMRFQSREPRFDAPVPVVKPRFNLSVFTIDQDYVFMSDKKMSVSVFHKIGLAYARYIDLSIDHHYNFETGASNSRMVLQQYYFADELGANVHYNFCRRVALCAGLSYRFVSGDEHPFGDAGNLGGLNGNIRLRFNIADQWD